MATLVTFHAHPDDEAIACGGTMARAKAEGHRVILVSATGGEHGEVQEGFLGPQESLATRRREEIEEAGAILGVDRVEMLGYVDSGMMGTPENDATDSFWQADRDEAATRLARILEQERADVLTVYDENGSYGHPDHIQVHRVGLRAAELAGTTKVYESVISREELQGHMKRVVALGITPPINPDEFEMGVPQEQITTRVDVSDYLEIKRKAMAAHASQISEESFFLAMPADMFGQVFGVESYILRGAPAGFFESWLFDSV